MGWLKQAIRRSANEPCASNRKRSDSCLATPGPCLHSLPSQAGPPRRRPSRPRKAAKANRDGRVGRPLPVPPAPRRTLGTRLLPAEMDLDPLHTLRHQEPGAATGSANGALVIEKALEEMTGPDGGIYFSPTFIRENRPSDVCINGMFLNMASYFRVTGKRLRELAGRCSPPAWATSAGTASNGKERLTARCTRRSGRSRA